MMQKRLIRVVGSAMFALAVLVLVLALAGCDGGPNITGQTVTSRWFDFHTATVTNANGSVVGSSGYAMMGLEVSGITTGTVNCEGTLLGSTYYDLYMLNETTRLWVTSTSADGKFAIPLLGASQVRCPVSGYGGGTILVRGDLSPVGALDPASLQIANTGDITVTLDSETVDVSDRLGRLLGKSTYYDVLANGSITNATTSVVELDTTGLGTVGLGVSGTWTGTIVAEVTVGDGVWDVVPLVDQTLAGAALSTSTNNNFVLGISGALNLRVRATAWTSGEAIIYLEGSSAPGGVFITRPLPTGVNNIGDVDIASIAAGVNNIGDMDVASIAAGETHIGEVGAKSDVISVTLSLDTGVYAAGDVLADRQQMDGAFRVTDGTGVIYSLMVQDKDDQGEALTVYFLNEDCALGTENSAVSIADSCLDAVLCAVEVASADYIDLINGQIAQKSPACLVEAVPGTDDLYVAAESEGTGTYTVNGIVLQVGIMLD